MITLDPALVEMLKTLLESPAAKRAREEEEFRASMDRVVRENAARAKLHPPPALPPAASPAPPAAPPPVPEGELTPETIADIARFLDAALAPDEYGEMYGSELHRLYRESPGALSTAGATEAAVARAFVAAGGVQNARGFFLLREVGSQEDEIAFEAAIPTGRTEWIVPGLIPAGCQVAFVGDQAAGKTTMLASLLAAVAQGKEWLGRPTVKCRAAVVNFDGRDSDLRQLLNDSGADGKVLVASYPDLDLTSPRFWTGIEKRFGTGSPVIIGIDSLSRGSGDVDEKDARFAAPILRAAEISSRYPITFVWLHHTPVTVKGQGLNDWLRGTSALGAAFDLGFGLSKVSATHVPRETIFRVQTLKVRPKEVTPPETFRVRLTSAGLTLHGDPSKRPLTDDAKVLEAVRESPGIRSAGIEDALDLRHELVIAARVRLEAAGAIENRGTTRRAMWFAT